MKNLYQSTIENNPFYQAAFNADFSEAANEKLLKQVFDDKLNELAALIKETLAPLKSLTHTAEVFHYSALAAVLLQNKAQLRLDEILLAAPPEHSIETMIMSQFGVQNENESEDIRDEKNSERYAKGQELAQIMGKPFSYTGSLMRALTMAAAMSVCACRKNDMANAYLILHGYKPTRALIDNDYSKHFPVIGTVNEVEHSGFAHTYSIGNNELYRIERDPNSVFCSIFADKLAELLAIDDMGSTDRARLEELRDVYFLTLCATRKKETLRSRVFTRISQRGLISQECLEKPIFVRFQKSKVWIKKIVKSTDAISLNISRMAAKKAQRGNTWKPL
jgi:hypothetical protein